MDPSYLSLDAFSSSLSSSLFLGDGANSQSSLGDYFNFEFTSATFSEIEAISSQKKASSPSPSSPSSVTTTTPKDKKLINGNASRTRTRNATGISTSKNAARERSRVKSLRSAFQNLQKSLPYVPPNTKLSKLDVLILATTYISHLMKLLGQGDGTEDKEPCASASSYSAHNDKIPGCQDENGKLPSLFQHSPPIDIHAAPLQMESNGPSFRSRLWEANYLHPVKKWPMRSRLYAGVEDDCQLPQSLQFGNRKQLCNDTYSSMLANIAGGNQDIFQ